MQPEPLSLGDHVCPNLLLFISLHAGVTLRFERLITLKRDVAGVDRIAVRYLVNSYHDGVAHFVARTSPSCRTVVQVFFPCLATYKFFRNVPKRLCMQLVEYEGKLTQRRTGLFRLEIHTWCR